jgi:hypothetical protein
MKRVVFVVHGIGRHDATWSKSFTRKFRDLLGALEADDGFDPDPLQEALEETVFEELLYDDLFQQAAAVMLEREAAFIEGLKFAGLNKLAKIFTTDASEAQFLRDNIFDILIYRAMREHRLMTRKHVGLQILRAVQKHGRDDVEYSVIAHSMGTAVIHDTLQEVATESGSPLRHGLTFEIRNLVMIANTSALLRNDFDPRESLIRPFVGPHDPGYVGHYWNFSHKYDPVAQIYSYEKYMKGQPSKRYTYRTVSHFQARNIHGLTHYLGDPQVYGRLFSAVYGKKLVPDTYVTALSRQEPPKSMAAAGRERLVELIEPFLETPETPDPDSRSSGLIAIAKLLPEVL